MLFYHGVDGFGVFTIFDFNICHFEYFIFIPKMVTQKKAYYTWVCKGGEAIDSGSVNHFCYKYSAFENDFLQISVHLQYLPILNG